MSYFYKYDIKVTKMLNLARQFIKNAVSIEFLVQYKNLIYKINSDEKSYILRLVAKKRRSIEQVNSELHFQNYLYSQGADVISPISALSGDYCISCEIKGKEYLASAFEFAYGKDWDERNDLNDETIFLIGKALGKIHRLSKEYKPNMQVFSRPLWCDSHELLKAPTLYEKYNPELYKAFVSHIDLLHSLPTSNNEFGLTHGDFLMSNYIIDGNKITVIDFDECEYSWYAMDLAICLRCYIIGDSPETVSEKGSLAEQLYSNLMRGYSNDNDVTQLMITGLEPFVRTRDFVEIAQLLDLKFTNGHLGEMEERLLNADLDRVLSNKSFFNF